MRKGYNERIHPDCCGQEMFGGQSNVFPVVISGEMC